MTLQLRRRQTLIRFSPIMHIGPGNREHTYIQIDKFRVLIMTREVLTKEKKVEIITIRGISNSPAHKRTQRNETRTDHQGTIRPRDNLTLEQTTN